MRIPSSSLSKRLTASARPPLSPIPRGSPPISSTGTSRVSAAAIPHDAASHIIACSCSGRPGKPADGNLTIQVPPTPCGGTSSLPATITAGTFSCVPASEKRSGTRGRGVGAVVPNSGRMIESGVPLCLDRPPGSLAPPANRRESPVPPPAGAIDSAPGRSSPSAPSSGNSSCGSIPADRARYSRSEPSGRRLEKNGGAWTLVGATSVATRPNASLNERLSVGRSGSSR